MLGTQAQIARLAKLSRARISQLNKEGFFAKWKVGDKYKIDECLKALGRNIETEDIPVSSDPIDFSEWRNLKMKEDALISQNERKIIEGDLLDRDAVLLEIGAAFHSAKTKLLAMPVSIAGVVATESDASVIKEIIEGSVREALTEISATAARLGASSDPQTAAAANG